MKKLLIAVTSDNHKTFTDQALEEEKQYEDGE